MTSSELHCLSSTWLNEGRLWGETKDVKVLARYNQSNRMATCEYSILKLDTKDDFVHSNDYLNEDVNEEMMVEMSWLWTISGRPALTQRQLILLRSPS